MSEAADLIDLPALLAPIPGDAPVGTDLREDISADALYARLRDARAEARTVERAQEAEDAIYAVPPQWRTIRDLAEEVLSSQSKDLEVAAWLTEALLRSDGLEGFTAGLQLMKELVEQYWDGLFPLPDEDGVETRVGPVASLNGRSGDGTLIQPLRRLTLFDRPDGEPLQYWQYEQAVSLAGVADEARRQQRIDAGAIPFETIEAEAQLASPDSLASLLQAAAGAVEAWRTLGQALDERAGADSPPNSRVRDLLEQIHAMAARLSGPLAEGAGAPAAQAEAAPAAVDGDTPVPASVASAVSSRAEALRSLAQIAAFFRRTEPLSPLAFTLEEVVRRAGMTWPQLLEEIIPDATTRAQVLTSLGIRPPPME